VTNPNQIKTVRLPDNWDLEKRKKKFLELEARVTKDANGCWLMPGIGGAHGYSSVVVNGQPWMAHRYMWALFNDGAVADGLFVLHRCDVRLCVCPEHLWLGTHGDNMRDAAKKGRLGAYQRLDRKRKPKPPPKPRLGLIKHEGRVVTLRDLADETGIPLARLRARYYVLHKRGSELVAPKQKTGPKSWRGNYPAQQCPASSSTLSGNVTSLPLRSPPLNSASM